MTSCFAASYQRSSTTLVPPFTLNLQASTDRRKEEDFVPELYGRDLLSKVDEEDITAIIEEAVGYVEKEEEMQSIPGLRQALLARLEFRHLLLYAVNPRCILEPSNTVTLMKLQKVIELLDYSRQLADYVPAAFSQKLQRRLASTTPPRQLILITISQALNFFLYWSLQLVASYDLCANAKFEGTRNLMVSSEIDRFQILTSIVVHTLPELPQSWTSDIRPLLDAIHYLAGQ